MELSGGERLDTWEICRRQGMVVRRVITDPISTSEIDDL